MAVRRCKKEDLKRICKATGGSVLLTLANLEGEESFDPANLGTADEVIEERIADDECLLIKTDNKKSSSIILRFVIYYLKPLLSTFPPPRYLLAPFTTPPRFSLLPLVYKYF